MIPITVEIRTDGKGNVIERIIIDPQPVPDEIFRIVANWVLEVREENARRALETKEAPNKV